MNFLRIRKPAAVVFACILGLSAFIPVRNAYAAEVQQGITASKGDPESDNSSTKQKTPVTPQEITNNSRFAEYTKLDCIDVSSHQNKIDWQSVADAGIDAAIIRAGYRGYDEGKLKEDKYFRTNLQGAYDAGLQVGVYFYTQAITAAEAAEEARFVTELLGQVKSVSLSLPVYIDMEHVDKAQGRLDAKHFSAAKHTELCNAFCDVIAAKGYQTGVYSNRSFMENSLLMDELEFHNVWLANYVFQTGYKGKYDVWQYSPNSTVKGIKGTVDRSVIYTLTSSDELTAPELPIFVLD